MVLENYGRFLHCKSDKCWGILSKMNWVSVACFATIVFKQYICPPVALYLLSIYHFLF